MSGEQQNGAAILEALMGVLGKGSAQGDLPIQLYEMATNSDGSTYASLAQAIAAENLYVIPVKWGGPEFDGLTEQIRERLTKNEHVRVKPETDRYDVFRWVDELQPTIGLFPVYRIKDRERTWSIIKIGRQQRVCIAMRREVAAKLLQCTDWSPPAIRLGSKRPLLTGDGFMELVDKLNKKEITSYFLSFGAGHAAPRILAQVLEKRLPLLWFFLRHVSEFHQLRRVQAAQLGAAIQLMEEGRSADQLKTTPEDIWTKAFKTGRVRERLWQRGWEASIRGLADELRDCENDEYHFIISDLGAVEFRQLLSEMGEYLENAPSHDTADAGIGPGDSGRLAEARSALTRTDQAETDDSDKLVVWEIDHGLTIPIGIGISAPALVRMSQLPVSEIIHQEVEKWFNRLLDAGRIEKILSEYGLYLDVDTALHEEWTSKNTKRADIISNTDHLYDYKVVKARSGRADDEVIKMSKLIKVKIDTLSLDDLDFVLSRLRLASGMPDARECDRYIIEIIKRLES
jgi:hypothetical protein